ncbi:Octanoyltransferase [Nitritalea halalkaliphila LW7]|uniref:Octanoyltransferase n=1 Tax=Nitritalea halalkaliphila LW7 TaxID=1189621 RepID=I5CA47_9BACT|nr:Octanoyltransferase [Nitritalea halalkaliphila LW7]
MNIHINRNVYFEDLGLRDYKEVWDEQERRFQAIVNRKIENRRLSEAEQVPTENHLLFVEHPHVYTLGKSGRPSIFYSPKSGYRPFKPVFIRLIAGGTSPIMDRGSWSPTRF